MLIRLLMATMLLTGMLGQSADAYASPETACDGATATLQHETELDIIAELQDQLETLQITLASLQGNSTQFSPPSANFQTINPETTITQLEGKVQTLLAEVVAAQATARRHADEVTHMLDEMSQG